ncbi:hypothetical protein [Natronobacterium texcoconense]|uniref:Uncharacterized protein n=1 Tax=Natronobacterium texcoconense TaxID=1095778 RepID=A0A1H1J155_NATTX|nr:hypothetical protein [Natronobacterium texcoconense]SDR43672.1 hypothetical protein SAMN04489842_3991 [Natronobacterium texcoconense]
MKSVLNNPVKVVSVVGLGIVLLLQAHSHYRIFLEEGIEAVVATPAFAVYIIVPIVILAIATNYLDQLQLASVLFASTAAVIGVGYLLEPTGVQLILSIFFGLSAVYSGFKAYADN